MYDPFSQEKYRFAPNGVSGGIAHDEGDIAMRIVTWNVRHQQLESRLGQVAEAIADSSADVVALQEVTMGLTRALAELLAGLGLTHCVDSITGAPAGKWGRKPFATMIVSRFPMHAGPNDWRLNAPFPESFARAIVHGAGGPVDVSSVHIPNGSTAGWKKVHALRVLGDSLAEKPEIPRIVAGDFNEPKELLVDGQIVTFSDIEPGERPRGHRLWTDSDGQTGDLHEWEDAVQNVLGVKPNHNLRNVHTQLNGGMFTPVTYIAPGRVPRWFDHVLISPELHVDACGTYGEWREAGISDHAGVWAVVS